MAATRGHAAPPGNRSLQYLKQAYTYVCRHAAVVVLGPIALTTLMLLRDPWQSGELLEMWNEFTSAQLSIGVAWLVAGAVAILVGAVLLSRALRRPVMLVDFAVYRAPESWKMSRHQFNQIVAATNNFQEDSLTFMSKVLARSGLGDETYAPPSLTNVPMTLTKAAAQAEFEAVAFTVVKDLLNKAGIRPAQVGIVITNSSLFNTTPSLAAQVMHHFKMGSGTVSYNLAGMGCSAGVIALDLASQMLDLHPGRYALVLSTENLTFNWYPGANKGMLVTNTLFRVGGAALLLTNKRSESRRAKYELSHVVRTNLASDDAAYNCVFETCDEQGIRGIRLSKELMTIAGTALKSNIASLGPLVLPWSEQLLFAANLVARKLLGRKAVAPYTPDFSLAFDHICIHTGGRGVIDAMESNLSLTRAAVEPSRAALFRYGNVSSSSIWYVLAYIETFRGLRPGDNIWQLGFGSGFKCNSAVWRVRRHVAERHVAWEGFDPSVMWAELAKSA